MFKSDLQFSKLMVAWYEARSNVDLVGGIEAIQAEKDAYFAIVDHITAQTPVLPQPVIVAYNEYQRMLTLTGVQRHHLDAQMGRLMDAIAIAMPPYEEQPDED